MFPPRKPPVKRAFQGLAGSPLSQVEQPIEPVIEQQKRGRPRKHKDDDARKNADKERKRLVRLTDAAVKIIREHPDYRGADGEVSGGYSPTAIAKIAHRLQAAEAMGLGSNQNPDEPGWSLPDRRRVSVPVGNPDNDTSKPEKTESAFVDNAMRRQTRSLRIWVHGRKRKVCPKDHVKMTLLCKGPDRMYCKSCGKWLNKPIIADKGLKSLKWS